MRCWFCDEDAQTFGWGFAVCGQAEHAERARLLGDPDLTSERRHAALEALRVDTVKASIERNGERPW